VEEFRERKPEPSERPAGTPKKRATDEEGSAVDPAYREVAVDIAEVLTAAERSAERIRATATEEAEQIRAEAKERAAAADAYAKEARRKSEAEAASIVRQAHEQARRIRESAERRARELELEAIRHNDELTRAAEGTEDHVKTLLDAFRRATSDLERFLPAESRESPHELDVPLEERVDDAPSPRLPQVWTIGTGFDVAATESDEPAPADTQGNRNSRG
jgi:hypothetical protein